jgi:hypothetical protein
MTNRASLLMHLCQAPHKVYQLMLPRPCMSHTCLHLHTAVIAAASSPTLTHSLPTHILSGSRQGL